MGLNTIERAIEKISTAVTGENVKEGVLDGLKAADESIKKLETCICMQGIAIIVLALIALKR